MGLADGNDVMTKIGFITCADLSKYFPSQANPLLTHDDQLACDYLTGKGCEVLPVVWGMSVDEVVRARFDILIVRSPWDYMETEQNTRLFFGWLQELTSRGVLILNSVDILRWNLDKHYLKDLEREGVKIVPTMFLEPEQPASLLNEALEKWKSIVVKPCISAAAKDTHLIRDREELVGFLDAFEMFRGTRAFMIQPFLQEITTLGEWSLVFLGGEYSHAVLKKPKVGGWLVQDELGGSVQSDEPTKQIREFACNAYSKLEQLLKHNFGAEQSLLYARVDVLPGLYVGELELVEPELFFLDRRENKPNLSALGKFSDGINALLKGH